MTTIVAKDLTTDVPRSPYDQIEGISWLPRVIDKVRALNAGKIGEYTPFPCGGDKRFLGEAGVEPDAFKAQVDAGKTDEEIGAWFKAQVTPEAAERLAAHRQGMVSVAVTDPDMKAYLDGYKAEVQKAKPDADLSTADNFAKVICIEEGHPIPSA